MIIAAQNTEAILIAGGIIGGIALCLGTALALLLWAGSRWPEKNKDYYQQRKQ